MADAAGTDADVIEANGSLASVDVVTSP